VQKEDTNSCSDCMLNALQSTVHREFNHSYFFSNFLLLGCFIRLFILLLINSLDFVCIRFYRVRPKINYSLFHSLT
jgi:hypothetical protein